MLLACMICNAQAPDWEWARSAGGNGYDIGMGIAIDSNANSFITGYFDGSTVTFDSIVLTNAGGDKDIFIAKYDPTGNVLWAKGAGGNDNDMSYGVAVDANGNSYIAGGFRSASITFGSFYLSNSNPLGGEYDVFVVKYDPTGNVLWAKKGSGTSDDKAFGLTVDLNGDLYVTGAFGSPTIAFGSTNLSNTGGGADIFVVKYNPLGNVIWAKCVGGNNFDAGFSIKTDLSGNPFVTGDFFSTVINFGGTAITDTGNTDNVFILKFDPSGNEIWANSAGGIYGDEGKGITVDAHGNSYITGYFFSPSITFGNTTLTNAGGADIFTAKYDSSGNVLWAKSAGGADHDIPYGISIDASDNTFITGHFISSTIVFGSTTLTNQIQFGEEIFIAGYDSSGSVLWAKDAGGYSGNFGSGITLDESGNIWIVGCFDNSSIIFGNDTLTTVNDEDVFIAKLGNTTGITEPNISFNLINIYPNPVSDKLNINIKDNERSEITLTDIAARKLLQQKFTNSITINTEQLAKGIYIYELRNKNGVIKKGKVVKD
jgi:hypothetical protein